MSILVQNRAEARPLLAVTSRYFFNVSGSDIIISFHVEIST